MTVSGIGTYTINNDTVDVGGGAYGNATIDGNGGGFNESVLNFNVGTAGGTGILNLVGGGAGVDVTVEDPLATSFSAAVRVGIDGTGTLTLSNGARLVSMNTGLYDPNLYGPGSGGLLGGYYNVNIGRRGTGTVTVDGSGSFLGAYGTSPRITVGRDGERLWDGFDAVRRPERSGL